MDRSLVISGRTMTYGGEQKTVLPYLLRFISMPAGEGWQFDPGVRDLQGSCQRQKVRPIFIVCTTLLVCTDCFHVVVVWVVY
jgi:hypothetical protein